MLFITWFEAYAEAMQDKELFAVPWSFEQPTATPAGIANMDLSVQVFPGFLPFF